MEDVTKNMTDLFDLAKNAKVDYPINNITTVISGSAATGAVGGATSFFKLSNIIIMLGSIITAVTVFVMVNPSQSMSSTAQDMPVFSKQETAETERLINTFPENDLIEENELKTIIPVEEEIEPPVVEQVLVVENVLDEDPEIIFEECSMALPGNSIAPFHSVHLNISANVKIYKGDKSKVSFNEDTQLEKMLEMSVENKVLRINVKDGMQREFQKYTRNKEVSINLTMAEVKSLVINGSGDIYSGDNIPSNDLEIQINGSGDVRLDKILPENFDIYVNGSGDVSLYGEGDIADGEININGSGDVCTRSIDVSKMTININGSGDVNVTCNDKLDVTILGSGDVCYSGGAEVQVQELGSGDVQSCD